MRQEIKCFRYTLRESIRFMFRKNNKSIVFFNNRDIVGFIECRLRLGYGDWRRGHQRGVKKKKKKIRKNRTAALSKLDKTLPCLSFVCTLFYSVFYCKGIASTDIATNQMRIHITLKICNKRRNWYFFHWQLYTDFLQI